MSKNIILISMVVILVIYLIVSVKFDCSNKKQINKTDINENFDQFKFIRESINKGTKNLIDQSTEAVMRQKEILRIKKDLYNIRNKMNNVNNKLMYNTNGQLSTFQDAE